MADNSVILNTELRLDETKLRQSIQRIEQQMKFRGPFSGMATDTTRFSHELDRATQRVITLGTAFQLLSTASRTIREIANSTIQVEKAMTDINTVFRLTNENLSKFTGNLFNIVRETGKTFDEGAKAAQEFARQGLGVAKTQEAVRAALILSRDANIDVTISIKALTAATNSFVKEGLSYSQIINKIAAADTSFAVSSQDLQEALIRVGSAASDAGVSFNELIALVTSAQQITARGGSVIAGALNTIFTRINRRDTLDALESLGVAITDIQGRTLPTLKVLENFSHAYDRMTGSVKNQAAELVGGVRQLNTLKAVLNDLSKQNSVFAQSLDEVSNAQDQADRRNAARNLSLSARMSQLTETGRQIGANIGGIGFEKQAKGLTSFLNNNPIAEALRDAGDLTNESFGAEVGRTFIKGFGGAVTFGLTPIIAGVAYTLSKNVFGNVVRDVKDIVMKRDATKELATLEQQIVALYQAGGASLQQQVGLMTQLSQQAAVFKNLLSSGSGGNFSASAIASALYSQGTRPIRRAAEGYVPMAEEMAAISKGVGGAPLGARPVYLPNFDRGGGQRGIVANTSEFIVPHLAGGSAIYNQDMVQKYGLPPGSKPVAADGYIPNASFGYLTPITSMASMRPTELGGLTPSSMGQGFGQYLDPSASNSASMLIAKTKWAIANKILLDAAAEAEKAAIKPTASYPINRVDFPNPAAYAAWEARRNAESAAAGPWRSASINALSAEQQRQAIDLFAAPGLRQKQQMLRVAGGGMIGPPMPPPIIPGPSAWGRFNDRLNTPGGMGGAMALAFALPAIGSNISDRPGGTMAGMGYGALSSGLNVAGFGASSGLMVGGGAGALVGAGLGMVAGGVYGALSKVVKSLDEITAELDQSGKRMNEQFEAAADIIKADDEKRMAMERGMSPRESILYRRRITESLARQEDPAIRNLLVNRANNPNWQTDLALRQRELSNKFTTSRDLLVSGGHIGGGFGGIFSGGFNQKESMDAARGLVPTMSGLSENQLKALQSLAQNDPEAAVRQLGQLGMLDQDQMKELMSPFSVGGMAQKAGVAVRGLSALIPVPGAQTLGVAAGNYLSSFAGSGAKQRAQQAITRAIQEVLPSVQAQNQAALGPGRLGGRALRDLASQYRLQSAFTGVQGEAEMQLAQAMQSIEMGRPMSARQALELSGRQGLSNISMRADIARRSALDKGRSELVDSMIAGGINEEAAFGEVSKLTSRGAVESLLTRLGQPGGVKGFDSIKGGKMQEELQRLLEVYKKIYEEEEIGLNITEELNKLRLQEFDAEKDYRRVMQRLIISVEDEAEKRESMALAVAGMAGNPFLSGSQMESGLMGGAVNQGMWGNARGSFAGGFKAHFAGLKQDMFQFAEIGNSVAQSLQGSLGNAFGNFVTGAEQAKDAFRSFAVSVLGDTSKMFASKAIQSIFGMALGNVGGATGGEFTGSAFRFAGGGAVPAMLTGGEFYIGPRAAKRIGYDTLRKINGYAEGGLVQGGSGVKDDVPARLPPGSFIVRKGATQRLGADYLSALANGQVQHRSIGGILLGGLLGGGLGYAIGGKKGALAGAVIGGVGGHFLSGSGAGGGGAGPTISGNSTPSIAMGENAAAYNNPTLMMDPMTVSARSLAGAGGSAWSTIGWGLGAAGALGLLARAAGRTGGGGSDVSRGALEAYQANMMGAASNRFAYLNVNSDGGNYINSFGAAPATRRWAEGGGVDAPEFSGPRSNSGGGAAVNVKIEINNNGQTSSKSSATGEGSFGSDFGTKLEKAIRPIVQDELVRQSRNDGFFTQRSRYVNG